MNTHTSVIANAQQPVLTPVLEVKGKSTMTRLTSFIKGSLIALATVVTLSAGLATSAHAQQATNYTYNDLGLVASEDGPRTDVLDVTLFEYDTQGNLTQITNALGHTTILGNYNAQGQPQTLIDPNGIVTELGYHPRGWLEYQILKHPTDSSQDLATYYTYDATGLLTEVTLPNGARLSYTYDEANRLVAIVNHLGERIDYVLDAAGNVTAQTISDGASQITAQSRTVFDELSRVQQLIGAEDQTTDIDYDANNNPVATTNPRSFQSQQDFDPLNRLTTHTDPVGGTTQFEYDAQGRLVRVTDANFNSTTYTYDALDNLIAQDSPDTGLTTYTYDEASNLTSQTDARGVTVRYTYDALNRLTSITYDNGAPEQSIFYSYDGQGSVDPSYSIGRLSQVTDASGQTQYLYNSRGQLTARIHERDGHSARFDFAYNAQGQLEQATYPSGLQLFYRYNSLGQLEAMDAQRPDQGAPSPLVSDIRYLPFGPVQSYTLGNGIQVTAEYDQDYRLKRWAHHGNQAEILNLGYTYDPNGNIIALEHNAQNTQNPADQSQTLGYDPLDRLQQAQGPYGDLNYQYDPVSNRLEAHNLSTQNSEFYNYLFGSNQLSDISATLQGATSEPRTFELDLAGNTIRDQRQGKDYQYDYNLANQLSQVTITDHQANTLTNVEYTYDANSQRTRKVVNSNHPNAPNGTTHYYHDSHLLLTEYQAQADQYTDYVYLLGSPIATVRYPSQEPQPDGSVYLINKHTQLKLRPESEQDGAAIIAASADDTSDWVRWRKVPSSNGYYYLQNVQTGKYFRPTANTSGATLEQRPTNYSGTRTQWTEQTADEGHVYLINRWTQKYIRPDTVAENGPVVLRPNTWRGNWTRWELQAATNTENPSQESALYYYHTDHLATPRVLTAEDQSIVWQASYQPFGKVDIQVETVDNNLRFPGQYYDAETQLHYNWHRYYDPSTGRYITSDPIGLAGGINTYGYAGQNSLIFADPDGLVYGLGNGRYSQYYAVKRASDAIDQTPFKRGFDDFWKDLFADINPYPVGSCKYTKRLIAISVADSLLAEARQRPGFTFEKVLNAILNNKAYSAGRFTASQVLSTTVNLVMRGRGASKSKSFVAGSGASLTGAAKATYIRIIKTIEVKMGDCGC